MIELLAIGKQIFEAAVFTDGVGFGQRYETEIGEKRTRNGLIFWHCLFDHKLGPAFEMRKMGFIINHPMKFNRSFRQWIQKQELHPNLKRMVNDVLLLIEVEKRMRKFEGAFDKYPELFDNDKLRHKYVELMRLKDKLAY